MHRLTLYISFILVLLAAGCGGNADEEASGTGTRTEGAEGPTEETTEPTATAAEAGDCSELESETITFAVPYDAGGGYDTYARLMAPYLEEEIGATVVVENQPGAGGLLAINSLLTAPADGTTIAIMNAVGSGGAVIADAEGVQFELDELSYVGRVTTDRPAVTTAADSEFETFQQVLDAETIRQGSNGPGAQDFITATVLNAIFEDLDAEIITGFDGSEEIGLALLRGELDIMNGSVASRLPAIQSGDQRPLLVVARTPGEKLPDTPVLMQMELDQRQQDLSEAFLSLLELGRAIVAPPELPEGPLNCLRTATREALNNPDLLAEAEQQERPIDYLSGEELDQLIANLSSAPEEFKQVIIEAH